VVTLGHDVPTLPGPDAVGIEAPVEQRADQAGVSMLIRVSYEAAGAGSA
jgi:hypothetical protein